VQVSALGTNAKFAHKNSKASERRAVRYRLQEQAARLLPGERVAMCMHRIAPGKQAAQVLFYPSTKSAGFGNLLTCGSVWVCPVCSAKITQRRRDELAPALNNWQASGGGLLMAAFTLRHSRSDELANIRGILAAVLRELSHHRSFLTLKKTYKVIGYIAASEITWNEAGGWHPHRHYCFITERQLTDEEIAAFERDLSGIYIAILEKHGRDALDGVAVKLQAAAGGASEYLMKWGCADELARQPVKKARSGGFSPFQLLEDSASGSETAKRSAALFLEYAAAMKGIHQVQYSRGIRELLGLSKQAAADSELAAEAQPEAILLAEIDRETWRLIIARHLRVELLEAAASGSSLQVAIWLSRLRGAQGSGSLSPGEQVIF